MNTETPIKCECDHDWKLVDDSFDHEYGCESIVYWRCEKCDATKESEARDFQFEDDIL